MSDTRMNACRMLGFNALVGILQGAFSQDANVWDFTLQDRDGGLNSHQRHLKFRGSCILGGGLTSSFTFEATVEHDWINEANWPHQTLWTILSADLVLWDVTCTEDDDPYRLYCGNLIVPQGAVHAPVHMVAH